jgi:hypothetical protein
MTALRMAKGIADKTGGPFAVIDTEARSASKYADRIPFDVDDLAEKNVERYIASMDECAKAGYKVLVIDSLSHAWRELTDEVDRLAQASGSRNAFSPWAKVAPKQKRLIDAILNFPGHVIATMRSKTEWVIGEGKGGRAVPEKMGLAPEQGKGIEYEFDLLIEMSQRHEASVTKDRTGQFQDEVILKPGEAFGVALYEWLAKGAAPVPPPPQTADGLKEARKEIVREMVKLLQRDAPDGLPYFTELERQEAKKAITDTPVAWEGMKTLQDLKAYLEEEFAKRKSRHAA